jgi:hypothetical protein
MKLEYLPLGAPECPLLRLYDFDQEAALRLRDLCTELAARDRDYFQIPGNLSIEAISGCRLIMKRAESRQGLRQIAPNTFECTLKSEDWDNIAWLLEAFCQPDPVGYQWLVDEGKIRLLFSCDGKW